MNGNQTNGDRVTDACLSRLARSFSEKCPPPDTCPLPSQLDDLCLACLLLAAEWGGHAPATTTEELTACGEKVSGRFWGDLLPWQLALALCHRDENTVTSRLEELTANLDHHNSSIRLWMHDVAWCVRDRLNPVEAHLRLLTNVADKLAGWDSSLGLCRALFPTDEAFWQIADTFEPPDFQEQYQTRLTLAHKDGLARFLTRFEKKELRLRRLICETTLELTPEEIKIVKAEDTIRIIEGKP